MRKIFFYTLFAGILFSISSCSEKQGKREKALSIPKNLNYGKTKLDSLKVLLNWLNTQTGYSADTTKVNTLNKLAYALHLINPDSTIFFAGQALTISQKINFQTGEANSYNAMGLGYWVKGDYPKALENYHAALKIDESLNNKVGIAKRLGNIGLVYENQGDYPKALDYYFKALKIAEELGNKQLQANNLGNIGLVYDYQADYPKALDYYFKALKIAEELGNKQLQANNLGNIGIVYDYQADYPKALDYYFKALKIAEELGNKNGVASILGNIGIVYLNQADYPKALDYYFKSLKIAEELGNKQLQANNLGNIGSVYRNQADYPKALDYYFKALKIAEELGAKNLIASTLGNIGSLYTYTGKFKEAEEYLKQAIVLDSAIGSQNELMDAQNYLSHLYDTLGKYLTLKGNYQQAVRYFPLALTHYKKAMVLKDTIFSEENKKQLIRKEMTYQFEKKQAEEKARHELELARKEEQNKQQKIIIASVLLLLIATGFFLWRVNKQRLIITQQKQIVEQQKRLVEEKNKEIHDSIVYARRIQDAILPSESKWKALLPDSFVLYLPKDIVAGDFYWLEETEEYIFVAAADCTGHGVPGAMVSVTCSNALNISVKESASKDTGAILDRAREIVTEHLYKEGHTLQDGMDIALIRINKHDRRQIQFSGANRPLWILNETGQIQEINGDKQPVGYFESRKPFASKEIVLEPASILYLFTDGYADQFGGEKNKKLGQKKLKEFLLNIYKKDSEQQKEEIQDYLTQWKGETFQVDDITMIGIKV